MTENEAIEHLKEKAEDNKKYAQECEECAKRKIDKMMGLDKVHRRVMQSCIKCAEEQEQVAEWLEELQQYRAIGTIEEFKDLKEKSVAKKPIINERIFENGDEVLVDWKCPICGLNVIEETPCQEYCQRCGNKLDWQ